jgi:hypothetical protein
MNAIAVRNATPLNGDEMWVLMIPIRFVWKKRMAVAVALLDSFLSIIPFMRFPFSIPAVDCSHLYPLHFDEIEADTNIAPPGQKGNRFERVFSAEDIYRRIKSINNSSREMGNQGAGSGTIERY